MDAIGEIVADDKGESLFALILIGSKLAWDLVLHRRERRALAADSRLEDSTQ